MLRFPVGKVQQAAGGLAHLHVAIEVIHGGQLVHGHIQGGDHIGAVGTGFFQQGPGSATLLLHQRQHQMDRFNGAVALPHGQGLRV